VNVRKNDEESTGDMIVVDWDLIDSDTLRILGYKLYANSGRNDNLRLVYDGSRNPQLTSFTFNQ
jgi:hypothetical protein